MKALAVGISLALSGCSLAYPLDAYEDGNTGGGNLGGGDLGGGDLGGGDAAGGDAGGSGPVCEGGPNPPLSGITSDFDAGVGENLFLLNCATIVDGEVQTTPSVQNEFCWVGTTGVRRLACDQITVRIVQVGEQSGVHRLIYVRENDGPGAINVLQEGGIFGGDLTFTDSTFDLAEDGWWRVSADQSTITFSTSADGVTWKPKGSAVASFPLDNINIAVGSGMWQAGASPSVDRFDCFNVGPPCGD